jgi:hypothetical protein
MKLKKESLSCQAQNKAKCKLSADQFVLSRNKRHGSTQAFFFPKLTGAKHVDTRCTSARFAHLQSGSFLS